jgi:hypothetical protein
LIHRISVFYFLLLFVCWKLPVTVSARHAIPFFTEN